MSSTVSEGFLNPKPKTQISLQRAGDNVPARLRVCAHT
jgi:hypothetical protein